MNIVVPTSQPAPKIYSLSSRIIAVISVVTIITLIVAIILLCIKSWHINFIGDFITIACALAHISWVVSTVNMLCQEVSKWHLNLNKAALITPNAVIVIALFVIFLSDLLFPEIRYAKKQRELMSNLMLVIAFTPPIIAWLTNTTLVIRSMIQIHRY